MNCSNEKQTKAPSSRELGCEYGLGVWTLVYPETSWSPEGKFGRDIYAGVFLLTDVNHRLSMFYAMSSGKMMTVKQIHHKIRNLMCEEPGM